MPQSQEIRSCLQCAAPDRDGSEDLKGRFWCVQCWKTWSKDWWVLERDWTSIFSQAEFETTYNLKLGRPPTRHESLDPIPCRREPPQSAAIVVHKCASSYPRKRHGSNPSLGSLSTHEDDFVYLVASSLYGDGGRGGEQLSMYSLEGAVLHGFITERRAKHLTKWTSAFSGAIRINPGVIIEQRTSILF